MAKTSGHGGPPSQGEEPASNDASALSQLSARLAHVIGAPAQAIQALADDVLDTALSTLQRQQVRHIRAAADDLLHVVNDLADCSSLDSGTFALLDLPFSLRDEVAHIAASRIGAAQQKGLLLCVEVDSDVPDALRGDAGRLGQVLGHLLDTVMASSDGQDILLRVEPEFITHNEATLSFAISDSGSALPNAVRAAVKAAPNAAWPRVASKGTDLGLLTARGIIKAMGGQLQAGTRPGGGSMLSFSAAFGIAAQASEKVPAARFDSLVGLPMLIVADDAGERDELARLFHGWHMQPQEADGGEMAIALLERGIEAGQAIPLVVFTNVVRGQDGFMLAMQIKRHPQLGATSLIMLTSEGRRGDATKCRENGVTGYLPKPINPHDLHEAVNTIMGVRDEEYAPTLVTRHSLREQRQGAAILLVEDDRDSQLLAAHFLDRNHFSVVLAGSGAEALKMAEQQSFDLVLLDMELQGLDGMAVARKIRAAENAGSQVPIIAITAGASVERERRYKAAGITDVLVKPLKRDMLLAMVFRYASGA